MHLGEKNWKIIKDVFEERKQKRRKREHLKINILKIKTFLSFKCRNELSCI